MNRSTLIRRIRPALAERPRVAGFLRGADASLSRLHHSLASAFPRLIQPQPRQLTIAVTAACNLRCIGCLYGRDFMAGERLPREVMLQLVEDAKACGINRVRLYGGEPLLHPDLPDVIRHSTSLGLDTYVTTNGVLLGKRIDQLYDAGLRWLTIGFYGVGDEYDSYTQRKGHYQRLEESLAAVRSSYGSKVEMQLNFVLLQPTCNMEALHQAWSFAERFDMHFHLDLYGYSVPFFTDPDRELAFGPEDREQVEEVCAEILRLKATRPGRIPHSDEFLRSVPDWLLKGADMRVPCDAYQLVWVGADGTVQLCDVTFKLGNVHEKRLREILFTPEHRSACRDGFQLKCPNCTCKADGRILKHAESYRRYRG
ncbi:MAG: radical SAM protein [Planctomycetota bacterium]